MSETSTAIGHRRHARFGPHGMAPLFRTIRPTMAIRPDLG